MGPSNNSNRDETSSNTSAATAVSGSAKLACEQDVGLWNNRKGVEIQIEASILRTFIQIKVPTSMYSEDSEARGGRGGDFELGGTGGARLMQPGRRIRQLQ